MAGQVLLTTEESSRAGPLFFHWIISINIALAAVIAGVLLWRR